MNDAKRTNTIKIRRNTMRLQKTQIYIVVMFAAFSAFDSLPALGATSDCHPRIRDAYFSTLLQTDKQ